DLHGREIDRIEPGGAEPLYLDSGNGLGIAGVDDRSTGDVAAGFADRVDAAEHDVVDQRRVETVALAERNQGLGCKLERCHLVKGAIGFAAPARRPHMVVDEAVGHLTSRLASCDWRATCLCV